MCNYVDATNATIMHSTPGGSTDCIGNATVVGGSAGNPSWHTTTYTTKPYSAAGTVWIGIVSKGQNAFNTKIEYYYDTSTAQGSYDTDNSYSSPVYPASFTQ